MRTFAFSDVTHADGHEENAQQGDDEGEHLVSASFHPSMRLRHDLAGLFRRRQLAGKRYFDEGQRHHGEHHGRSHLGSRAGPGGHNGTERQQVPEVREQPNSQDERHPEWSGPQCTLRACR